MSLSVEQRERLDNIINQFNEPNPKDKNDGLVIKINNNTIYRSGVEGEVNVNKVNEENLNLLESLIENQKKVLKEKIEVSLYWKPTQETLIFENGDVDIKKGNYSRQK